MITDKKNNNKVLQEDNDLTPADLVTLEGEGTETKIFLVGYVALKITSRE